MRDSVTVEPFHALPLDISMESIKTVDDALWHLTHPEHLEHYNLPSGGNAGSAGNSPARSTSSASANAGAIKKIQLESVPPVLILQLKRFVYRNGAVHKVHKFVPFAHRLVVPASLFGPTGRRRDVHYQLIGGAFNFFFLHQHYFIIFIVGIVVDHHGANAQDGHYTCDVRRANGQWIHIDDTLVFPVSESEVTDYHPDREAYILFYHCLGGQ